MSEPPVVPRPAASGEGSTFAERLRAVRGDARVGIAILLCVSVAAGAAWFRAGIAPSAPGAGPASSSTSTFATTTSGNIAVTTTTSGEILVDVVGAVRVPGVVRLPAAARVFDAIREAGGAAPGADLERLNLAAKLGDGARVAVPLAGQPPPAVDPAAVSGAVGGATDPSAAGSIDANGDPTRPSTSTPPPRRSSKTCPASGRRWRRRSLPSASSTGRSGVPTTSPACTASARAGSPSSAIS